MPVIHRQSQLIVNGITDYAIFLLDPAGVVTTWTPEAARINGHGAGEIIGRHFAVFYTNEDRNSGEPSKGLKAAAEEGQFETQGWRVRKDGSQFWASVVIVALRDADGQVTGFAKLTRDLTDRKNAEQELEKQTALLELAHDSIIVRDLESRITFWNRGAEDRYGWKREEALGNVTHSFLQTQFPESLAEIDRALREDRYWAGELVHTTKAGKKITVASRQVLQCDGQGNPAAIFEINNDITERKQAEQALKRSEERLRALFEFSPDAIITSNSSGIITQVNSQTEKLFGYERSELLGQPVEMLIPERFRPKHPSHRQEYHAHPRTRPMGAGLELFGKRKDGSEFSVDIMLSPMEEPEGQTVISVVRDISERRKAQEATERSEARFRALFEASPDAIVVCDREGRIVEANARVESIFGYQRNELLGQSIETLIPERFRHSHLSHRKEYSATPRVRPMGAGLELFGRRKDGSEFPADIMLGPVETANGPVVLGVVRDLTEKREAEEALRKSELQKRYLEEELITENHFDEIIGESVELKRVLKHVETVSTTDVTVLILGETGTGKEVIARAIHQLSPRNDHVMVKLNCAAIPAGLLESELFGHEKGAFTGAQDRKIGRLELAHEGTLFLDEIGDLPLELQPKILRALQEREFERLGSTKPIPVNVRLIAATNRDLAKMVSDGHFRSDLYYRLRVFPILLPPLRERREDIPLLVRYFVDRHSRRLYKKIETIPDDVMRALTRWDWPGNIRELENFIERAVILSKGPALRPPLSELQAAQPASAKVSRSGKEDPSEEDLSLEATEREHILRVLRETNGKISGADGAAARLGLVRTTLNSKMKKLGIRRKDY